MAATKPKSTKRKSAAATSTAHQPDRLDFTLKEPPPTPRLSLHRHYGARYENDCWVLEPGGAMQFRLHVSEPDHTTFALEIHSSFDAWVEKLAARLKSSKRPWLDLLCYTPDTYNPVMLTIGNEELTDNLYWQERLNPLGTGFTTKRLILGPAVLFPGENFVTLWLSGEVGVVPLHLKSVSVSDFRLQRQEQTQWCWAAVTASIMEFMTPERAATQSEVVAHTLQESNVQSPEDLNRPEDITKAAKTMGLEGGTRYGNVSRDTMRWLVNEGTPIPIQINWRNNGRKNGTLGDGHYVVVNAICEESKGQTSVQVEDPWVGEKLNLTWDELKNDYPGQAYQYLYKHKEPQQCSNWSEDACQCQWRGKWTYTHVLVPKEWGDDQYDEAEYEQLIQSVDTRLMDIAERDGFLEIFEKPDFTVAEVTDRIEEFSHQLVKLNHQIQDLETTLSQLEALRQSIIEKSSKQPEG